MSWEEQLFALFDDLEQQAEGMFHAERDLEIADRGQSEYAAVTLASRLMASLERDLVVNVRGLGAVRGSLQRVCADWVLVSGGVAGTATEWIIRLAAVSYVSGVAERSLPEAAWSPVSKLGLGSALRRIAAGRQECVVHLIDGTSHECRPTRVGGDFVEARTGMGMNTTTLFAFEWIGAVQKRELD
jgi:hypothetical protein